MLQIIYIYCRWFSAYNVKFASIHLHISISTTQPNRPHRFQNLSIKTSSPQDYYRPQRSWGKVIFSEACVKNSVHRGGVCPIACFDMPPEQTSPPADPPRADTPLGADPPGTRPYPPPPPGTVHAGRCGQQAGGTHPTGMQTSYS